MKKTILITGATDGIGLETAKLLAAGGHTLLLHGRCPAKLEATRLTVAAIAGAQIIKTYEADLTHLPAVTALSDAIKSDFDHIDVLINNAGVFKMPDPITEYGFDARFVVNTIAPYVLTRDLLPVMNVDGRVVNLSSAAQAPVNLDALLGRTALSDGEAYAQSKLAITA